MLLEQQRETRHTTGNHELRGELSGGGDEFRSRNGRAGRRQQQAANGALAQYVGSRDKASSQAAQGRRLLVTP